MRTRRLGKTELQVSEIGFGGEWLERHPEEEGIQLIRYAASKGINILDCWMADPKSRDIIGKGIHENRSHWFIQGHIGSTWKDEQYFRTRDMKYVRPAFEDLLKRLQTDYIDVYMLHSLTVPDWYKVKDLEVLDFLDDCLASGKVKHVGFSSHIEVDYLIEILDEYPKWEVVLTQMNYLDEYYQSGIMGLDYLKQINVGSMIMEPLRGGRLVQNIPKEIQDLWDMAEVKRTPVEWALQYLWNRDDVDCVLSGMTSLEQVKENIKIASTEDIISDNDQELIREVARTYRTFLGNRCTRCGYCMPCPHGVDIINCLTEYNIAHMMNDPKASAMQYFSLIDDDSRADSCIDCKECIPFCTQMLDIPKELQKVYEYFGSEFDHF